MIGSSILEHRQGKRGGVTGRGEPGGDRLEAARLDLDRVVAEDAGEVGSLASEPVEDRHGEGAGAGAVLAEDERLRAVEAVPRVGDGPGERGPEDRVRLGCGQEVAFATGAGRSRAVVASLWVVQREVHEPGEGDRAVALDLGADALDQLVVLSDRREIRLRVPSEARGHIHVARRGGPSTTSRTPGPTSV